MKQIERNIISDTEFFETEKMYLDDSKKNDIDLNKSFDNSNITINNSDNKENFDKENEIPLTSELNNLNTSATNEDNTESLDKISIPVKRNTKSYLKDKIQLASENQRLIRENGCTKLKYKPEQCKTIDQFKKMIERRRAENRSLNTDSEPVPSKSTCKTNQINDSKLKETETDNIAPLRNRIKITQDTCKLLDGFSDPKSKTSEINTSIDSILKEKYKKSSNLIELKTTSAYREEKELSEQFLQRLKHNLLNNSSARTNDNTRSLTADLGKSSIDSRVKCVKTAGEIDPMLSKGVELLMDDDQQKNWMSMTARERWKKHRCLLLAAESEKHRAAREERRKEMNVKVQNDGGESARAGGEGKDNDGLSSDDYEWTEENNREMIDSNCSDSELDSSINNEIGDHGDSDDENEFGRVKVKKTMKIMSDDEENDKFVNNDADCVNSNCNDSIRFQRGFGQHSLDELFDHRVNFYDIEADPKSVDMPVVFHSNNVDKDDPSSDSSHVDKYDHHKRVMDTFVIDDQNGQSQATVEFQETIVSMTTTIDKLDETLILPSGSDQTVVINNSFQQHLIRRKLFTSESEGEIETVQSPNGNGDGDNGPISRKIDENDSKSGRNDDLVDIDDVDLNDSNDDDVDLDRLSEVSDYRSIVSAKIDDSDEEEDGDDEKDEPEEIEDKEDDDEEEVLRREVIGGHPAGSKLSTKFRPSEFFDEEAELSGSDADQFGPDEEDDGDVDLDKYEEDEGVESETLPSEGRLRRQIERIHNRLAIDEDAQNLRYLKELYLEDGDLHLGDRGPRKKRFGWVGLNDDDGNDNRLRSIDGNEEDDSNEFQSHDLSLLPNLSQMNNGIDDNSDEEEQEMCSAVNLFHVYQPKQKWKLNNKNNITTKPLIGSTAFHSAWETEGTEKSEVHQSSVAVPVQSSASLNRFSSVKKYGSFMGKEVPISSKKPIGQTPNVTITESVMSSSNHDLKFRMQQHTFSVISREKKNIGKRSFVPSKDEYSNSVVKKKK